MIGLYKKMSNWKDRIHRVTPYVPGEQPKVCGSIIKLNTNEFPYPPSPKVRKALDSMNPDDLRLYPDVTAAPLAKDIAAYYGVDEEQVFVGVGSDDVLSVAFLTCFSSGDPILFPNITYSFYDVWADVYRIPYKMIPLDDNLRIVKEDYYTPNGGIVLANPNAPTGIGESKDFVEDIVKANQGSVVIVDEAYVDFGGESSLELVNRYDNVLVVRTFSKARAFAGMRIGFAIGSRELIKCMNDVKFSINSYTMNRAAIELGRAELADDEYFKETVAKVIKTREWTKNELGKRDFSFPDSKTNFVFAHPKKVSAEKLFKELRERNIFVRWWDKDILRDYLRISIGTDDEMRALVDAIDEIQGS